MSNRRRRFNRNGRREGKRVMSTGSVLAATVAALSVIFMVVVLAISANKAGNTSNVLGGIAMIAMLLSVACTIFGIKQFKDKTCEVISRMVGLIVPILSLGLWIILYMIGLFLG